MVILLGLYAQLDEGASSCLKTKALLINKGVKLRSDLGQI